MPDATKPHVLYLTWSKLGGAHSLTGEGPGADRLTSGACIRLAPRSFIAHANVGGEIICGRGATARAATNALHQTLDRRSIGLFGVDDVVFETGAEREARRAADVDAEPADRGLIAAAHARGAALLADLDAAA